MDNQNRVLLDAFPGTTPSYVPLGISDGDYHRFFGRIFHDSVRMTQHEWQSLASKGLAIGNCSYMLVLLSARAAQPTGESLYVYRPVSCLVKQMLLREHWGYQVEVDGCLAVLFCYQFPLNSLAEQSISDELEAACAELVLHCQQTYGLTLSCYIGCYIHESQDIAEEFEHIRKFMLYDQFMGKSKAVNKLFMRDAPHKQVFRIQQFAEYAAQELVNQLLNRDYALPKTGMQQLQVLQSLKPFDVDVLRANYKYLVEQIYEYFVSHQIFSEKQLSLDEVAWKYMLACKHWDDVETKYISFLAQAAELYQRNTSDRERTSISSVMKYICDQYKNPELTVAEIGEHAGMKTATVCAAFKKSYGITIFAQLRQLRMDEACRLLRETDLPVCEVCQLAGFGSQDTMYRAFERTLHMTPGAYRKKYPQ